MEIYELFYRKIAFVKQPTSSYFQTENRSGHARVHEKEQQRAAASFLTIL